MREEGMMLLAFFAGERCSESHWSLLETDWSGVHQLYIPLCV